MLWLDGRKQGKSSDWILVVTKFCRSIRPKLIVKSEMMMSFGDHGRAPRNLLGGIAFDAMTISYSVVFNWKDAFPSCVTSPSGNTIFGSLDKKSFIILYISNVEKISRKYVSCTF